MILLLLLPKELLAAFVSGVNACKYCTGAHTGTAIEFRVEESLISSFVDNIDTADVDDNMKPIFKYLEKLTDCDKTLWKLSSATTIRKETGKYMTYAIGEIKLVVIGILLAIRINHKNERRKDHTIDEENSLKSIRDGIS